MRLSLLRLTILSAPLALTACGDGWEAVRTTEYFPYGNQRTAGSGVAYVLAKMLPEKDLSLEEQVVEPPPAMEPQEPAPALEAEQIFNEAQTKGAVPPPPKMSEPAPATEEETKDMKETNGASLSTGNDQAHMLLAQDLQEAPEISAENEIAVSAIEPAAGEFEEQQGIYPNRVIQPSHVISMPKDHIVTPKVDVMDFSTEGQKSLHQIYKDDF